MIATKESPSSELKASKTTLTLADYMNDCYVPSLYSRHRFLVLFGGAGSGKSVFAAMKQVVRAMMNAGHRILVLRKVAKTIRQSVWRELIRATERMGVRAFWVFSVGSFVATYIPNGSEIICMGMDDEEKVKSIEGITSIWCEEATEFFPEEIDQLNLRVRGACPDYRQIILSFNPISQLHWLRGRFFEKAMPLDYAKTVLTTYRDNRFIDDEYRRTIEAMREYNPELYAVYGMGQWGILKGLIYRPWNIVQGMPDHLDETIWGLDFGYNNPTALVRIGIKDTVPVCDEEIYARELTTDDLIKIMDARHVSKSDPIYADCAEPDRIEELIRAGYNVYPADKSKGSVMAGINTVKKVRPQVTGKSSNIVKELGSYSWKENPNANLKAEPDEPVKFNDHAMDAIRYALHTHNAGAGAGDMIGMLI